jgi:predicted transcriptional regulator
MNELTKSEEQIMQILWNLEKGFVKEIIDFFPDPKPAYNTVSTIVRILEDKKFIDHNVFGRTFQYYPIISKQEYTKKHLKKMVTNYFNGSFKTMVSFFSSNEDLSVKDLEDLKNEMNKIIDKKS